MALPTAMNLLLRGLQFLWTLLLMALIGDIISDGATPSIINYDMFVAVIGMLSLFYLIPAAIKDSLQFGGMVPLILDLANTLFWFCGAVATAAKLGVHSCDSDRYLRRNSVINGSSSPSKSCTEAQASTAFLFFGFACWVVSAVFSAFGMGGGANLRSGGIRRGPAMSQVG